MKRFLKGFFGMLFMLFVVTYVLILFLMVINNQPIGHANLGTVSVGVLGAIGFIMFKSAIENENIF